MKPIETPKVFISYAWGSEAYQEKVLQFCTRLQTECGVEVIVDKWSMDVGYDTYDFMERCAKDPGVNFVIMLLDKNYAEKADARQGGVGTETQIISARVYANTEQRKFIPVVFARGDDGKVHKPEYLVSRFHFDLTKENANEEFMRLVRHLYGEKTYPVPPIGKKPDWVSQPTIISPIVSGPLYTISNTTDDAVIKSEIKKAVNLVKESVFAVTLTDEEIQQFQTEPQKYLNFLGQLRQYRDAVITALGQIVHKDYFTDIAADFFEEYKLRQDENHSVHALLFQATGALLHEIFIYSISLLWEAEEYSKIRDLITRTYFIGGKFRSITTSGFTDVIYSGGDINMIDNAKKKIDNKNYLSGLAQLWTEHVMTGFSLDQITFADLLIYNLSIFEEPEGAWYWFPLLYVYALRNPIFERFATKLKSSHQIKRIQGLFGDPSPDGLNERIQKMSKVMAGDKYRYHNSFDRAPLILDYVRADEIGKLP